MMGDPGVSDPTYSPGTGRTSSAPTPLQDSFEGLLPRAPFVLGGIVGAVVGVSSPEVDPRPWVVMAVFGAFPWRPGRAWKGVAHILLTVSAFWLPRAMSDEMLVAMWITLLWFAPSAFIPEGSSRQLRWVEAWKYRVAGVVGAVGALVHLVKNGFILGGTITAGVMSFFIWLYRYGSRVGAPTAEELLEKDPRPPVLYLRSFSTELLDPDRLWRELGIPNQMREEEALASAFSDLGPFITIGRSTEVAPSLGAARLYATDDEWQSVVRDFLRRARMVVVAVGDSDGLRWEVAEAVSTVPAPRLIFYFSRLWSSKDLREHYEQLRSRLADLEVGEQYRLPETISDHRLLSFDANGVGRLSAPLDVIGHGRGVFSPLQTAILRAEFRSAVEPLLSAAAVQEADTDRARHRE